MEIRWFGHASFGIFTSRGTILTDPFDESVGYRIPDIEPDVVLVSHEHYDHNNTKDLKGNPVIIRGSGIHKAIDVEFEGIRTYHDDAFGAKRGENTVFVFEVDGLRLCHLGDLGDIPADETLRAMKGSGIEILFTPVGGVYTIDWQGANKMIDLLKPKITIPMHFKTQACRLDIDPVDPFLEGKKYERMKVLTVDSDSISDIPPVVLLEYE
ncbi:MAG TPA: MBL fold metallo-hydrolase [Candidatus Syntrophoarchaeum butanivorans]|uniref:Beta-lactamase fold-like protein Zn-dependent hydrolase n=1 Tax=Candidatus Syntropharchaeum butanivorans TaxID=1839936 RepID=A0A1F2P4J0_9EURY|nr:MAG: beta-lactamase fold-like protein Zn-dependent hydrolase [Candidatus Syntrophoarchaeum butanivorans]HEC57152.1 MBL fold metallo-hydrolase [Candidatus Syntrophoarchaeum butanivorans]